MSTSTTQEKLDNAAVAERLEAFAALLDLAGASYYTARAYRRAAELIRSLPTSVAKLVAAGRVRELRGIGPGIEARLRELVETGEIAELRELERSVAPELVGFGRFLGLSAKRAVEIGRALGVETADEFRAAVVEGRLREVPGIGPKTEAKLHAALEREERPRPRRGLLINKARPLVEGLAEAVGGEVAGDPRRWRDTSEYLSIVSTDNNALDRFGELPQIVAVVERDERRAVGVTVEGAPVELVVAGRGSFGTELLRATGSADYVAALEPLPAGATEEEVYAALGVPWCPPELREEPHRLEPPRLLELPDMRGDLHCHTTWSDGKASVLEMAEAARERGYEYLAICDHTPSVGAVPGLSADEVRRQGEEIAEANARLAESGGGGGAGFRVLRGIECDIRRDGTLDLPDDVLAELDWVMASVHGGQRGSRDELTMRVTEAMRNPSVRAISHPTGRYIGRRPENALDLEEAFAVALETATALELNGLPDRLDLRGEHVRAAIEAGVEIVVSTDAHSVRGLGNMELAVATARRGWATAENVLNTRPLSKILRRAV
jgi:DNA polymerase (family 10)